MGNDSNTGRVKDMTSGGVVGTIILFALPIYLGNLFQQFYNIVDTMLAGRYLGDTALAAIGATGAVYSMVLSLANGMNNGYAIIVARAFGEKDYEKVRKSVALMLVLNIAVSIFLMGVTVLFLKKLLILIQTPELIMEQAYSYILIILLGLIITIFYNMEAAVLRALGNSRTPLVFLLLATGLNVVLDITFMLVLHWGVAGLAAATVIAQLVSVILCFIHIKRHYSILKLEKDHFQFAKADCIEMFSTGLSMGLMYSIFNIGTLILQRGINGLGTQTITAHLAARKIDEVCMMLITTLSTANATFVGQNFGAGNIKRVRDGIHKTCLIAFACTTIVLIVIMFYADILVKFMTGTQDTFVIETASAYLKINLPFFYSLVILQTLRTSLQGMGDKITPVISSVLELLLKMVASFMLIPLLGYMGACIIEPIIWVICMLWLLYSYRRFMKKVTRKIAVGTGDS